LFIQRAYLGDPAFDSGVSVYQQEMLDTAATSKIRNMISDFHTLNVSAYNPEGFKIVET